ncbi:hypothetical protein E1B28_000687 [Marasmius oreades]|uniref:U2 snRNP-associated SURP motif-containing protein n=1 Tax=Marasmius oreades TaxID=181124 RepID=A0A9P7V201_9AGAR|nr:uncharacterized protein E1B28_000687 [Marasmius oreades]KAG7098780.1 hypothetical protein E1B28_000687 [Marasmius oreades]
MRLRARASGEEGFASSSVANERKMSPPPMPGPPKPKGKREMDTFLEELKKDQAEREARYSRHSHGRSVTAMAAYEGQSGSKDRGDPQTSNIFVANLPPHVTEQSLGNFFARVGPVGSVKVMWPRNDASTGPGADMTTSRRSKNSGLSGFVSFMTRKDAEEALREFDGFDWGGSVLRVGWSKAVPIAAKPMFTSSASRTRHRSRSRSISPARAYQGTRSTHSREHHGSYRSRSRSRDSRSRSPKRYRRSRSRSPKRHRRSDSSDREEETITDTFIRAVAAEVKGHDSKYEGNLRKREANNSKYGFLRKEHRRHAFYRGLIEDERPLSPEFDDEGYNSVYSTDSAEESERERTRKVKLGRLARKRFEAILRALSGKRGEIARCMAFSLEHAEAAHEVADIIVASLLVDETPVPRKVARLHLICDILHNSAASVPSAWKFRQEFQARLGIVFDHMANIYHSFPGRITAETFKKQITSIVDVWEDWIVFPPDFTSELRERLEGIPEDKQSTGEEQIHEEKSPVFASRFKVSTFRLADEHLGTHPGEITSPRPDVDGEPLNDDVYDPSLNEDIDGAPIDHDSDSEGIPIDADLDGAPIDDDDIDGIPIDHDIDRNPIRREGAEDLDGEPVDNLDGDPMDMED